jgi:hypothetical protein
MACVGEQETCTDWCDYMWDVIADAEACKGRVRHPTQEQMVDGRKEQCK